VSKERRLGRGLEALLGRSLEPAVQAADGGWHAGDGSPAAAAPAAAGSPGAAGGLLQLSVYEIDANPFQPRRDFDDADIQSLSDSIHDHGLLQPIVVRQVAGRYQLIAGERRLRAAIKAGCNQVPAHLVQADDRQASELAIVENLQRKDLNPLEKAASFQQYLKRYGCTQEELAGRLKIDRSTVANLIRLLELPETVQDAVRNGAITQGHARALLPLGDEHEQVAFCDRIQVEGLSVRATEEQVQDQIRQADEEPLVVITEEGEVRQPVRRNSHLTSLEQTFRAALGTKVEVKQGGKGRGKIIIHFASHEEFDRLQELLCPTSHERRKSA
jgi:ParB family chromosome partitioning protein